MPIATDAPVVIGSLGGLAAMFVVLTYLIRRWPWSLLAEIVVIAAVAATAVVWPRGDELDTGVLAALVVIPPAMLALICTGLGIAIRSIIRPRN